jgi:hypothetical protein
MSALQDKVGAVSDKVRADKLRFALEQIGWMDEFLDADGAKAMLQIARNAVNEDEAIKAAP